MPAYDHGQYLIDNHNSAYKQKMWQSCMWASIPMLANESEGGFGNFVEVPSASDPASFIETDVKIRLRVATPYLEMGDNMSGWSAAQNDRDPYYTFKMDDIAVVNNDASAADSACELLNVVPNPYYA